MLNIIEIRIRPQHKVICHKFPNYDINAKYLAQFVLSYRFGKKSASRLLLISNLRLEDHQKIQNSTTSKSKLIKVHRVKVVGKALQT